jgi:FolB domain-containing protein
MFMDQIIIKDLLVQGILGVNPQERTQPQDILVNLTVFTDTHTAGITDNIHDCIHYGHLVKKVRALILESNFFTVEALAAHLAELCLQDPRACRVRVRVEKPTIIAFVGSVGVEIERDRTD